MKCLFTFCKVKRGDYIIDEGVEMAKAELHTKTKYQVVDILESTVWLTM